MTSFPEVKEKTRAHSTYQTRCLSVYSHQLLAPRGGSMFFFRKGWDAVGGYLVHGPEDGFSKVRRVLARALPQHHSCTHTTHFKGYIILYYITMYFRHNGLVSSSRWYQESTRTCYIKLYYIVLSAA